MTPESADRAVVNQTARRVVQNSVVRVCGYAVGAGLYFLINILIARYLGTEGFGIFSFIVAFVGVFQLIVDMGIRNILIRDIAVDRTHFADKLGVARTMMWILSVMTMTLIVLFANVLQLADEVRHAIYLAGFGAIVTFSALSYSAVLRAFEEMEWDILGFVLHKVILLALTGAVIRLNLRLQDFFAAILLANSCLYVYYWGLVRIRHGGAKVSLDLSAGWALCAEAFPLAVAEILSRFTWNLGKLLLAALASPAAVGLFSAAYRVLEAFNGFTIHLTLPIFPVFSRLAHTSPVRLFNAFEQTLKFLYVLGIPLAVLQFVFAERIVLLFFGDAYREAGVALRVLAPAVVLLLPASTYGYVFAALGHQRVYTGCVAASLAINIALDLLLIPFLSYIGAAIGTLAGQTVLLLAGLFMLRRLGHPFPRSGSASWIWPPFLAALAMGLCCWLVRDLSLPSVAAGVIGGFGIFAGLLWFLKTFTDQEQALFMEALRIRRGSSVR
jgi:O-antigen/teichoic acid export membrane protein